MHSHNWKIFQVDNITEHPKYDSVTRANDVALMRLTTEINITPYVRPICLWDDDYHMDTIVGQDGIVRALTLKRIFNSYFFCKLGGGYTKMGHKKLFRKIMVARGVHRDPQYTIEEETLDFIFYYLCCQWSWLQKSTF